MLQNFNFQDVLFLDIETVPLFSSYDEVPDEYKYFWDRKTERIKSNEKDSPESIYNRAGIYAEFGKIICISVAIFSGEELRVKSFYSATSELEILTLFAELLNSYYNKQGAALCAHNGKEFDFPYIARRMLINGISLPNILNIAGKKPWEINHYDTMELWKFGDYKNYTSLNLLAYMFNIPSPKDDIDGSMVADVFYKEHNIERIVKYCEKDVITIVQIMRKYLNQPLISEDKIKIVK